MNTQDYHKSITTTVSAEEAFQKISSPSIWWTANIKGSAKNLNDVFTMFTERDTVTLQVVEVVPNKKLVWLVTDCQMLWLKDPTEWKNTQMVFEISEGSQQTSIDMTHVGLVPEVECYHVCEPGWNGHLNNLAAWLETGIAPLT
ncbi:MAG TPA: SRPBCC domain-containing protein [Ktedonobacteraceae bacterium]|jgi:uncharacterized protein YndB with AHSA1/START domain|nr:SRPBCC domain-containing protein [Ktedonobacteraceae bacterium]